VTGEQEEDIRPGALAAFSSLFPLFCTSEDSLAQAALGGWSRGSSTGISAISLPLGGMTFGMSDQAALPFANALPTVII